MAAINPAGDLWPQFRKSKLLRHAMREYLTSEGMGKRDAAMFAGTMCEVWPDAPEPFIKRLLYAALYDPAIPEGERREAARLLQLATTTFTKAQRETAL